MMVYILYLKAWPAKKCPRAIGWAVLAYTILEGFFELPVIMFGLILFSSNFV
jgi:hypothetical protein